MTPPSPPEKTADEPRVMSCLEVWGGNEPADLALKAPGLDIWTYAVPYDNAPAGGDVHFVSSCAAGRIARMMVADVAGHGHDVAEPARNLRKLIRRHMNTYDQRQLVADLNRTFSQLAAQGLFATALVLTYIAPTGELRVCNAGHPPPLVLRRQLGRWSYLESQANLPGVTNIPLGILPDVPYEQFELVLEPGDLVLGYTDSLVEAVCRDGSLLGPQRLWELADSLRDTDPAHLLHHLVARLSVHGAVIRDDVTLMLARCVGRSPGAGLGKRACAVLKLVGQTLGIVKS